MLFIYFSTNHQIDHLKNCILREQEKITNELDKLEVSLIQTEIKNLSNSKYPLKHNQINIQHLKKIHLNLNSSRAFVCSLNFMRKNHSEKFSTGFGQQAYFITWITD